MHAIFILHKLQLHDNTANLTLYCECDYIVQPYFEGSGKDHLCWVSFKSDVFFFVLVVFCSANQKFLASFVQKWNIIPIKFHQNLPFCYREDISNCNAIKWAEISTKKFTFKISFQSCEFELKLLFWFLSVSKILRRGPADLASATVKLPYDFMTIRCI
jgi:hypothetical protein